LQPLQLGEGRIDVADRDPLAVDVTMITASTSRKLPNVSWPIESENDRGCVEIGGNSEVM